MATNLHAGSLVVMRHGVGFSTAHALLRLA